MEQDKRNWNNLTKLERSRFMKLQMRGGNSLRESGYKCNCCNNYTSIARLCADCFYEWKKLENKLYNWSGDRF